MAVKDVARHLGKSENAVHTKRCALGIRSHNWTAEEDKVVRMWHSRLPAEEISARLPGRTAEAVVGRARQLGFRSDVFWKDGEIQFLKANPGMSAADAARTLGKTLHAVHHKRRDLGMTRKITRKTWTDDDRSLLITLTKGNATAEEIAAKMGRTKASIHCMQRNAGLGRPRSDRILQPSEKKFLQENPDMSAVEIAKHIKRTPGAVRAWRRKIGLPRYQDHNLWTSGEIELLRSNLQLPRSEIHALFPSRSPASVDAKAGFLGRKRLRHKGHTYRNGYKRILPRGGGKVWEHRRVAEEKIGRPLRKEEVVHHINYVRFDNRPENLDVLENKSTHAKIQKSVNDLIGRLLQGDAIGYDRSAHSYFLPSKSFGLVTSHNTSSYRRHSPELSYVFCGDRIFPFPLLPDKDLADTLGALPHSDSILPLDGRHAVTLCGATASPALLEDCFGASASPFPVVRGTIVDHYVVPTRGEVGVNCLVQDELKHSPNASATVWAALLDARQLGVMDACAGRGSLCDLVEATVPVKFENGEGLSTIHSYVPRIGSSSAHGSRIVDGSPLPVSRVLMPFIRSRSQRKSRNRSTKRSF